MIWHDFHSYKYNSWNLRQVFDLQKTCIYCTEKKNPRIFRCKNVILNTCCLNYNCHMKYLQLSQWKMTATQGSRHHTCPSIVVCCCQFSAHGSEQMLLNCGCSRAGVWLPSCIPNRILTYRTNYYFLSFSTTVPCIETNLYMWRVTRSFFYFHKLLAYRISCQILHEVGLI